MQSRIAGVGNVRPSGTDGSDFSYRMIVDSRYTKVAKGKSRLSSIIFAQAIVQFVEVVSLLLSLLKEEGPKTLAISSATVGFLSLFVGELGRRRSKVNFLRFYMFASSIAVVMSIVRFGGSNLLAEVIQDPSRWQTEKFELVKIACVLLGQLLQIFALSTAFSLIHNMSPPKRAS